MRDFHIDLSFPLQKNSKIRYVLKSDYRLINFNFAKDKKLLQEINLNSKNKFKNNFDCEILN